METTNVFGRHACLVCTAGKFSGFKGHVTNVLVFGSRTITDYAWVKKWLFKLYFLDRKDIVRVCGSPAIAIISGKAPGPDQLGERFANEYKIPVIPRPANWNPSGPGSYNPKAGFERNSTMVAECDEAVGFWDGVSRGTKDTIDKLVAARKNHVIVTKEGAMCVTFEK